MLYYWLNVVNMVEIGGPFKTESEAKADAVATYNAVQHGMALNILIIGTSKTHPPDKTARSFEAVHRARFDNNERLVKEGQLIADGHIEGGEWGDGAHPKTQATERAVQKLYRKRPVIVEAALWDGSIEQADRIEEWSKGATACRLQNDLKTVRVYIPTLEGEMRADPGDWIIKGVNGEFYPCKPDIFEKTYEKV